MAYATDRKLREKGETPTLYQDNAELLAERALVFPKLQHSGGADDAPNAWRTILRDVQSVGLEMKIDKTLIPITDKALANHPLVFMHGRYGFKLSAEQRDALRKHLELGGTIFADSICASQAFTKSFRDEMKKVLGRPLAPIDPNHEIWTDRSVWKKNQDRETAHTQARRRL